MFRKGLLTAKVVYHTFWTIFLRNWKWWRSNVTRINFFPHWLTRIFNCQVKNISNNKLIHAIISKHLFDNNTVPNKVQYIPPIPFLVSTGHHISTLRVSSVFLYHEESCLPNCLKGKILIAIKTNFIRIIFDIWGRYVDFGGHLTWSPKFKKVE